VGAGVDTSIPTTMTSECGSFFQSAPQVSGGFSTQAYVQVPADWDGLHLRGTYTEHVGDYIGAHDRTITWDLTRQPRRGCPATSFRTDCTTDETLPNDDAQDECDANAPINTCAVQPGDILLWHSDDINLAEKYLGDTYWSHAAIVVGHMNLDKDFKNGDPSRKLVIADARPEHGSPWSSRCATSPPRRGEIATPTVRSPPSPRIAWKACRPRFARRSRARCWAICSVREAPRRARTAATNGPPRTSPTCSRRTAAAATARSTARASCGGSGRVARGRTQSLAVANVKPSAACVVPRLKGTSLARARKLIKRGHCAVGRITRRSAGATLVRAQSPKAGTALPKGARIHLSLAA
jgi:hypothetical protein